MPPPPRSRSVKKTSGGLPPESPRRSGGKESRDERPSHAKTDIVVSVPGVQHATIRRADEQRMVAPRSAAENMRGTISTHPCTTIIRSSRSSDLVINVPAILDPLPNIPVNVMQTERIRTETPDRRRALIIPTAPAVTAVRKVPTDIVAPVIPSRRPGPGNILPLGLAQQAVSLASFPRQPTDIRLRVLPTHANRRVRIRLRKTRRTPTPIVLPLAVPPVHALILHRTPRRRHETIELPARNLVNSHRKRRRNIHAMNRKFGKRPLPFLHRRTHHETPGRNNRHLRAMRAIPENVPNRKAGPPSHRPLLCFRDLILSHLHRKAGPPSHRPLLCFRDLILSHLRGQRVALSSCRRLAPGRREVEPHVCLDVILQHTDAPRVDTPQRQHRPPVVRIRRRAPFRQRLVETFGLERRLPRRRNPPMPKTPPSPQAPPTHSISASSCALPPLRKIMQGFSRRFNRCPGFMTCEISVAPRGAANRSPFCVGRRRRRDSADELRYGTADRVGCTSSTGRQPRDAPIRRGTIDTRGIRAHRGRFPGCDLRTETSGRAGSAPRQQKPEEEAIMRPCRRSPCPQRRAALDGRAHERADRARKNYMLDNPKLGTHNQKMTVAATRTVPKIGRAHLS